MTVVKGIPQRFIVGRIERLGIFEFNYKHNVQFNYVNCTFLLPFNIKYCEKI